MVKATQVQAVESSIQGKDCCMCGKPLAAPYGRNNQDRDWVCSNACQSAYYTRKERERDDYLSALRLPQDTPKPLRLVRDGVP